MHSLVPRQRARYEAGDSIARSEKDRVFHWNAEWTLVVFFSALGTKPSGLGMRLPQHT